MNGVLLGAGAAVGAGIALIVRGLAPPVAPLAEVLADLRRPRPSPPDPTGPLPPGGGGIGVGEGPDPGWGWLARAGRPATSWLARAGLPTMRVRTDLDLLERPASVHLAEQAATAVIAAVVAPALAGVLAVGGVGLGLVVPAWGCLLLGAAGFWVPDLVVRANATARRAEFTHALGAFLDLVVIGLAGGAGVDAALSEATRVGHGWAFDRLRHTLQVAEITRTTPWAALAQLGDDLQIPVLREVAAAVGLAGTEGAKIRASLAAKASGLRLRELTSAEATAIAATEQMSLPVIVMFTGFLVFIAYPAVTSVFGSI